MFAFIWPIALVVITNVIYQICTKSVPAGTSPFAVLIVTYLVSAATAAALFFALDGRTSLAGEFSKLNWASYVLGLSIVGMEVGWIYAYKAGWQISRGFVVQSAFLSIMLLAVGYLLYHEALTWNKVLGVLICLVGLAVINYT